MILSESPDVGSYVKVMGAGSGMHSYIEISCYYFDDSVGSVFKYGMCLLPELFFSL